MTGRNTQMGIDKLCCLGSADAQFAFLSSPNQAARQFIEITAGPNMQKRVIIAALVGGAVMVAGITAAPAQEEEYEHGQERARAKLAVFNDRRIVVHQDDGEAAKWYQKSIDTKFVDEIHGCEISGYPGASYVDDYAVMLLYGRGVPKNEKKAKEVLANGYGGPGGDALLVVLHNNALPKSYEEFLGTNISALAARLPRNVDKRSQ
jgi:hypothetical protein